MSITEKVFKGVVALQSNEQYEELKTSGSITINGVTFNYEPDCTIYTTPDTTQEDLNNAVETLNVSIEEVNNLASQAKSQATAAYSKASTNTSSINSLTTRIDSVETTINNLDNTYATDADITTLQEDLTTLETEVDTKINDSLNTLRAEFTASLPKVKVYVEE